MYLTLIVIQMVITLSLIGIILIQRPATDGLGSMGGGNSGGGLMTARGQANLLTRTTAILATLFIVNSLALSWLTQQEAPSRSLAEQVVEQQQHSVPTPDENVEIEMPAKPAEVPLPQ